MTTIRRHGPLLLLPALFVALLFAMRSASLPFWQVFNLDPDYYYLLNGLMITEGLAPTDVSHPGTPVQVFIAAILRLMHAGLPTGQLVDAVLADPERHLVTITSVLYPLVGLGLVGLGLAFRRATGRLAPALLAQAAPFLSMIIPKFGLHPKPEPFLIIAVCLVMAAALELARDRTPSDRKAALMGLAVAFGIACKLQFLALGLVPLFLLDRRRLFIVYPIAVVAGFLILTSPALPSRDIWFGWVARMVLHSGAYGAGAATVVDTARYPKAVLGLFGSKIIFTATFVLSLAALAGYARLRRRSLIPADPLARLLAGILLGQLFTILLIAKQAAAHYMVPALMLTGPALAILWVLTAKVAPPKPHGRVWLAVGAVLALVTLQASIKQYRELARWTHDAQSFDMSRFGACAKIDYDSSSSPAYALLRGDLNTRGRYSPKLEAHFPADTYAWFINDHTWWSRGFMRWNHRLDIAAELANYPCLVFRGNQPYTAIPTARAQIPGFKLTDTCEVGEETVFTMGVKCDGALAK
jgi:hypothetical protein